MQYLWYYLILINAAAFLLMYRMYLFSFLRYN